MRNPAKAVRVQLRIVRDFAEAAGITSVSSAAQQAGAAIKALDVEPGDGAAASSLPDSSAPADAVEQGDHRPPPLRHALGVQVSNLKRLKDVTGGTLNDVVMAIVAGALRDATSSSTTPSPTGRCGRWCRCRSAPATRRSRGPTACPASSSTCRPTTPIPLERVAACREAMDAAKRQFELVPAEALVDIQQYSSPVVATSAIRLAARLRLADRMAPPVNVIISNVPGPRQPLYLGGARMQQYIPVSTIAEGMGLNITVHSYLDELDVRADRLPRARARPVGHGRPAHRRDRPAVRGNRRGVGGPASSGAAAAWSRQEPRGECGDGCQAGQEGNESEVDEEGFQEGGQADGQDDEAHEETSRRQGCELAVVRGVRRRCEAAAASSEARRATCLQAEPEQ